MGSSKSKNNNSKDQMLQLLLINRLKNSFNYGNTTNLAMNMLNNQQTNIGRNNVNSSNTILGAQDLDELINQRLNVILSCQNNLAPCQTSLTMCSPCHTSFPTLSSYFSPYSYKSSCYSPPSVKEFVYFLCLK